MPTPAPDVSPPTPTRSPGSLRVTAGGAVEEDGPWGYIDHTGEMVIEPQFDSAGDFSQGLAQVLLADGTRAYIDREGVVVWPGQWK